MGVWRRAPPRAAIVSRSAVAGHFQRTGSQRARAIMDDWLDALPLFWQVCPKEMVTRLEFALTESEAAATAM